GVLFGLELGAGLRELAGGLRLGGGELLVGVRLVAPGQLQAGAALGDLHAALGDVRRVARVQGPGVALVLGFGAVERALGGGQLPRRQDAGLGVVGAV